MTEKTLTVVVFSDDSDFRKDVVSAVGKYPWAGAPEATFLEAATSAGVVNLFAENDGIDLCIFDGEVQKEGAMSVAHLLSQTHEEIPPIIFVVARPQDEWLARGAGSAATLVKPLNSLALSKTVEKLLR
ncbi:hypothetical protein KRX54_04920 [Actinomycetaceae bacterium TAE3-ERU4]|nr:hypothetical protein [Actinomycetaceae bacterium TAE3-ERU4]